MSSTTTIDAVQAKTWAQEETLRSILYKLNGQTTELKKLNDGDPDEKKDKKELSRAMLDTAGQLRSLRGFMTLDTKNPTSALNLIGDTAIKASSSIASLLPEMKGLAGTAVMFSEALAIAAASVNKLFEVNKIFLDVYDSGMRLQGGMNGLLAASTDAGMHLDEFGAFAKKNSATFALLGNSTPAVLKQFQQMTKFGSDLMMSQSQANEAFMETIGIFQNTGSMVTMTNERLISSGMGLIKETDELSKETGRSRKSILEFANETTKSGKSYLLMSTLSASAQESFQKATLRSIEFGDAGGKMLMDNVQNFVRGGRSVALLDDNFRTLLTVVPDGIDAFTNFAQASTTAGGDVRGATKQLAETLSNIDPSRLDAILKSMPPELQETLGGMIKSAQAVKNHNEEMYKLDVKYAADHKIQVAEATRIRLKQEEDDEARNRNTQLRMGELNQQTIKLGNEFTRIAVSLGETVIPVLVKLVSGINTVYDWFHALGKSVGSFLGQDEKSASTSGGMVATVATVAGVLAGPMIAGKIMGASVGKIKEIFRGAGSAYPQPPPMGGAGGGLAETATEALGKGASGVAAGAEGVAARGALTQGSKMLAKRIPLIGGVISGGLTALEGGSLLRSILVGGGSALGAVGGGIAGGAAGLGVGAAPGAIAGGMGGEWLGNKLADLIEGKKETTPGTAGEAPKEIGSMFNSLTDSSLSLNAAFSNMNSILSTGIIPAFSNMNSILSTVIISNLSQLGTNLTNIQGKKETSTAGETPKEIGSMFNALSDSSMSLNAAFSNMNSILSNVIISNLSQLGTNLTNTQGMPDITRIINERSSQISSDLQESLSPILGGTTTSNDNAIFQDSAQTYYQSSNVYYDRSLQLFTDIRDSNVKIKDDIASLRSLVELYVRTVRTLPQGAVQPAGVPV